MSDVLARGPRDVILLGRGGAGKKVDGREEVDGIMRRRSENSCRSAMRANVFLFTVFMLTGVSWGQHLRPRHSAFLSQKTMKKLPMPHLDMKELTSMVDAANDRVTRRLDSVERILTENGIHQYPGSPAWFMAASSRIKVVAKNISKIALISEEVSRQVARRLHLDKDQINLALPTLQVKGTLLGDTCPLEVDFPCQPRKYRAYSGYCNNVQNPRWGNANTRYLRFLPSDYGDGVSSLRSRREGSTLPNPRHISITIHQDIDVPHSQVTTILAIWGELIAHDIHHTSQAVGYRGQRLRCCDIQLAEIHPECAAIAVSSNDPFYASRRVFCLDYIRSCMSPRTGCTLGPREQVNQVTSFLDASVIYGSSKEEADDLRTFQNGLLQSQRSPSGKGILPADENMFDCKLINNLHCFKSGDIRVNENIGLTLMQTLWFREHNRIASKLQEINPHWNDETLFQEARDIVAAEMQHIHYNEFLPIVLGKANIAKYGLNLEPHGPYHGYDININAGIANAIAAAVLHFIYSLLPGEYHLFNTNNKYLKTQSMSNVYYAPQDLYDAKQFDYYLVGFFNQRVQMFDQFVSSEITNQYFTNSSGIGMDKIAHIIQQGRDHGIPAYIKWRKFCDLPPVNSFHELSDLIPTETISLLQTVYKSVEDIDLFTGGLSEFPLKGAVLGPTFACLLGRQFHYIRTGDRYWYENDIPPSSFTKEQLVEIRKVTLARIICDNGNDIKLIQPQVMLESDPFLNSFMKCSSDMIKSVNLQKWKSDNLFVNSENLLQESLRSARQQVERRKTNEQKAFLNNFGLAGEKSPIGVHLGFVRPKKEAISISNTSLILQYASQRFVSSFLQGQIKDLESNLNSAKGVEELMKILPNIDISEFVDLPRNFECDEQTLPCDHTSRFRTITGLCNNLDNPMYGKSFKAFQRLLPPQYNDNLLEPRKNSVTGSLLPSARLVSISVHSDTSKPHVRYSLMVMQFGQFVDHDLSHTPVHTGFEGAILDCSRCDSKEKIHPECYPILIPSSDPYFPVRDEAGGSRCLSFVRSLPGQLTMGPREQINQITAFVDCSHVFGSDVCDAQKLRSFSGGRLNVTRSIFGHKDLLPETSLNKECKSPNNLCFEAGDKRASEQISLAAMHTLYMREHNRIVGELALINPHWNDEQLYLNGRRILDAINQHIVYNEFLPRILGWNMVHDYGLEVLADGYYNEYDPTCNPTIYNEFATAAFRFGHSLIKPFFQRLDKHFNESPHLQLRHKFFNPGDLHKAGMIDEIMRGLVSSTMETLDQFVTDEVTNHLFEDVTVKFSGLDLVALNIQRGREHGIATYNEMRAFCNMTKVKIFEELSSEIPHNTIQKLKAIYRHVDDIDLFTGGLSELPLLGGVVGPTFACIIARQFQRLRKCDRFWYETSNPLIRFTVDQLMDIRKATLAKIICENSDSIDTIQRSVFDMPDDFSNPRVPCDSIPKINLELWRDSILCSMESHSFAVGSAKRVSPCVMCTCTKEGPLCQSMKITNCFGLVSEFSAEVILTDHVCKVQCAFVFRASPQVNNANDNILTIST